MLGQPLCHGGWHIGMGNRGGRDRIEAEDFSWSSVVDGTEGLGGVLLVALAGEAPEERIHRVIAAIERLAIMRFGDRLLVPSGHGHRRSGNALMTPRSLALGRGGFSSNIRTRRWSRLDNLMVSAASMTASASRSAVCVTKLVRSILRSAAARTSLAFASGETLRFIRLLSSTAVRGMAASLFKLYSFKEYSIRQHLSTLSYDRARFHRSVVVRCDLGARVVNLALCRADRIVGDGDVVGLGGDAFDPGTNGGKPPKLEAAFIGDMGIGIECYVGDRMSPANKPIAPRQMPLHHAQCGDSVLAFDRQGDAAEFGHGNFMGDPIPHRRDIRLVAVLFEEQ